MANAPQRTIDKLNVYYLLLDASTPDLIDKLLPGYPISEFDGVYICDPNCDDWEINEILGFLKSYTNLTDEDVLKIHDEAYYGGNSAP